MGRGKPGSKMHILSDQAGLPLVVGVSAGNTHDSGGRKPMVIGLQTRHAPDRGRYFRRRKLHADKAYDRGVRPRCRHELPSGARLAAGRCELAASSSREGPCWRPRRRTRLHVDSAAAQPCRYAALAANVRVHRCWGETCRPSTNIASLAF